MDIDYNLLEQGFTTLYITDLLGKNALEVFSFYNTSFEKQSKKIPLNDFPNGLYFLILQSPSEMITKRFVISR